MAVRDIKTTIMLDGEKAFEAELRAISKEMRVTNSELKVLKTGFDNADDQMANLTRQSQLAKEKLELQKIVVAALEREVRDAARVHGDASDEVKDLTLELNSARVAMNGMVKESQQVDREIEELGRDSQRAGRQIKNGIGDAAEETSRDLRSMMDTFSGKLGDMRNMLGIDLAMDLGSGVVDLVQGVNSFAESSRDFNRQMSFLENNARKAGLDLDFVKDKFIDVASVTGETDGAVEGLSNLLQTGFDETEMEKAIRGLTGAVIEFPDTMKFETLGEDLRKTLQEGAATGQFADVIVAHGGNIDEFNEAMEKSTTVEGDQQIVLGYLTGKLTEARDEYDKFNQDLIDAEASSKNLEMATADLGRTLDTWLTPGRNQMAEWVREFNAVLRGEKTVGEVAANVIVKNKNEIEKTGNVAAEAYGVINTIVNKGPALLGKKQKETVRDEIKRMSEEGVDEWDFGVMGYFVHGLGEILQSEEVKSAQRTAWSGVISDLKKDFGIMQKDQNDIAAALVSTVGAAIDAGWMTAVDTASDAEDYVASIKASMESQSSELEAAGQTAGVSVGTGLAEGLSSQTDLTVAIISAMVDQINAELSRVNTVNLDVNTGAGSGSASQGGAINVSLAMDGRTVGKVVAPYVMQAAGRTTAAMTTVQKK